MSAPEAVLLDTDVFSYLLNKRARYASVYKAEVEGKLVAVSFITVGEMLFGAEKRGWGPERVSELQDAFRKVTIVPFDFEVCQTYARIRNLVEKAGTPVAANDLWIAACAVRHSIPLVSNNEAHFRSVPGLELRSRAGAVRDLLSQDDLGSR